MNPGAFQAAIQRGVGAGSGAQLGATTMNSPMAMAAGGGMSPMAMQMIMQMLSGDKDKQAGPAPLINNDYQAPQPTQQFYTPYVRGSRGAL